MENIMMPNAMTEQQAIEIVKRMAANLDDGAEYWTQEAYDDSGDWDRCMENAAACVREAKALTILLKMVG